MPLSLGPESQTLWCRVLTLPAPVGLGAQSQSVAYSRACLFPSHAFPSSATFVVSILCCKENRMAFGSDAFLGGVHSV